MTREDMIRYNKIKILLVISLIGVLIFFPISAILYNQLHCHCTKNYNKEHIIRLYKDEYSSEIQVPEEVTVYFSDDIKTCNFDVIDTKGIYYHEDKSIYVLDSLTDDEKKTVIMHELAHHYYHYNMSDSFKEQLKYEYKLMCQNPNEMYAYREQLKYQFFTENVFTQFFPKKLERMYDGRNTTIR